MNLKKFLNKLLIFIFLISIISVPNIVFAYTKKVVLGGENIGIKVNSNGVLVVGFYQIDGKNPAKDAGLRIGDRIIKINDTDINIISDLTSSIKDNTEVLEVTYERNNKTYNTKINLYKDSNNVYKTGLYVKDKIIGIGTLTFIDPNTKMYGALGHEIMEKTTGTKFEIKDGTIFKSNVTGIDKGTRNSPGGKRASYMLDDTYGTITKNEINGIYGVYNKNIDTANLIEVADSSSIKLGKAYFTTVIKDDTKETFEINILKINKNDATKNIFFEITDEKLLKRTNGVVQGMSGSPIIQDGKLIGAVTHVVVDDSSKGYGIFITSMLKEIEN